MGGQVSERQWHDIQGGAEGAGVIAWIRAICERGRRCWGVAELLERARSEAAGGDG